MRASSFDADFKLWRKLQALCLSTEVVLRRGLWALRQWCCDTGFEPCVLPLHEWLWLVSHMKCGLCYLMTCLQWFLDSLQNFLQSFWNFGLTGMSFKIFGGGSIDCLKITENKLSDNIVHTSDERLIKATRAMPRCELENTEGTWSSKWRRSSHFVEVKQTSKWRRGVLFVEETRLC